MITKQTVFILGAGASCPYNYPTSKELSKLITNDATGGLFKGNILLGREKAIIEDFKDNLRGNPDSLDKFLFRNPSFRELGRRAIAEHILRAEQADFKNYKENGYVEDWLSYLFVQMIDKLREREGYLKFKDNNISFITFNYDRSLEFYLSEHLKKSFTEIEFQRYKIFELIPFNIIHVYGKLINLEWEGNGVEYGYDGDQDENRFMSHYLNKMEENIIHICEGSQKQDEIIKKISEAEIIFILGFGYFEDNVKVLGFPEVLNNEHRVFGTIRGKNEKEIEDIKNLFRNPELNLGEGAFHSKIRLEEKDCAALLREYLWNSMM